MAGHKCLPFEDRVNKRIRAFAFTLYTTPAENTRAHNKNRLPKDRLVRVSVCFAKMPAGTRDGGGGQASGQRRMGERGWQCTLESVGHTRRDAPCMEWLLEATKKRGEKVEEQGKEERDESPEARGRKSYAMR